MLVRSAVYLSSAVDPDQCPAPYFPEYAFVGRSNVGKSSLINMLTRIKGLAKVSGTPGKTQAINHFLVNDTWYLADLPGYGFAKKSQEERKKWDKMIQRYLLERPNLMCVFVLIDPRIEPQQNDLDMIHRLGKSNLPLVLVFTKADKQSPNKTNATVAKFRKIMLDTWEEMPPLFITSSQHTQGRDQILAFIEAANNNFAKAK